MHQLNQLCWTQNQLGNYNTFGDQLVDGGAWALINLTDDSPGDLTIRVGEILDLLCDHLQQQLAMTPSLRRSSR